MEEGGWRGGGEGVEEGGWRGGGEGMEEGGEERYEFVTQVY